MIEEELNLKKMDENLEDRYEIKKIDDEEIYKCKNCSFYTKYKRSLIVHLNKKKNPCQLSKKNYICNLCGKEFIKKDDYNKHMNRKTQCKPIIKFENNTTKNEEEKYENLLQEIEQLKIENNNLKKNVMTKELGYIYLIHEREFVNSYQDIYKIGKTRKENNKRFISYPKGSVLLFQIICTDCDNVEKELIDIFKDKFVQRKDIGTEYFQGDYQEMIDIIYNKK